MLPRQVVCKTITSHPFPRKFVMVSENIGFALYPSLQALAAALRLAYGPKSENLFIKNEAPGDIIWVRDDTLPDRAIECERLSSDEVHELAKMLEHC